ncbi:MAG: response regulator transcription factor [Clostridia bacterium]|nr:MAG: response regulator transcription factor [Clostridia bacterium]
MLVVEDDESIAKVLLRTLEHEGYAVTCCPSGEEALAALGHGTFSLVLLDLMLPGMDGYEVCNRIRQGSDVPILVLSARDKEVDKLLGFHLGADDYLTKPFSPAELVLRIKAVLRRAGPGRGTRADPDDVVTCGELEINRGTREVKVGGRLVELTTKEFDLLWLLASNPRRVFTRGQLLRQVWDTDYEGDTAAVTMMIKRLREKIEPDPARPRWVKTVRGVGYKLDP